MKLFLTKAFNKEFFNGTSFKCIIKKCIFISDSDDEKLKTAYNNDELNEITLDDLKTCDVWSINNKYYYQDLLHEPTLEYGTESNYNFYTYKIRIDDSISCIKNNISKKLRCIGLVNDASLLGILYFNGDGTYTLTGESSNGLTVPSNKVQQINLSLSFDEKNIEPESYVTLNDINDIIEHSHLETPDLVRYVSDNLKLKVTSNEYDKDDNAALYLTDDNFIFNVSGAPLITVRSKNENRPFVSLSNLNNTAYINNKDNRFIFYSTEDKGESYSIFSNNVTATSGSVDINSDDIVHTNIIINTVSDLVIGSSGVSSTITGYTGCKPNTIINGINDNFIGDDIIAVNTSGIDGKNSDFALGNNTFINSNNLYYDNGTDTRSEMNFTTIGSLNASSYNDEYYEWESSDNSVLMLGSNISSVNLNGNNNTFIGFSGLASNNKVDSYIIGSFNNPSDASLLTFSTGWFNKTNAPKIFDLERDYVYATDEKWIQRNNLINIFDDKDIPYEYYEHEELVSGMINDATCIQLGEDTFITTNEIVSDNRSFEIDGLMALGRNTDIFAGQALDNSKVNSIKNQLDKINTFIIHLQPSSFNGTSPSMSIDDLILKIEIENKTSFLDDTIYIVYTVMEHDEGNDRWIIDSDNKKKYINNGDVVACTQLQILNRKILN